VRGELIVHERVVSVENLQHGCVPLEQIHKKAD
jgi:hypothetical protein